MKYLILSLRCLKHIFLTALCFFIATPALYAAKPVPVQQVIVAPVTFKELADRVEAIGTAQANESVSISSNVTEKVKEILFEDGQQVKAGDPLIVLEYAEEQANLQQAKAVQGERKLALDRLRRLAKKNLSTHEDLDRARLTLDQANANITAIQARINDRIIKAPFDGITGLRELSVGTLIEAGDKVATLDDTRTIKLDFSVPAIFLAEIKPGLKIEARADAIANKIYQGEIKSIDSRVDPVSRSVKVRAILANSDGRILPGILMQVDLLRNLRTALVIPESALLPMGDKQFVMLRKTTEQKDLAEKRAIKIGIRIPGWVEVQDGLSLSDQVITHGNDKVRHGAHIKILAVDDGKVD
ncbi:MAG: efflux RND transporter periplasmic adaptor subunit, partial [Gammaproteobacteria bacterium]|nr:efflux RND transporter periplasmic adaptor subunit [Gammaproteobacteria bacterium]